MAAGVALIAPASGAFPDLLVDRKEGRLFEPGNAGSLAGLLHDAERSADRYERYGRQARRAYESRFDPDDNVRQLLSIYGFAMGNPAGTAAGHRPLAAGPALTDSESVVNRREGAV